MRKLSDIIVEFGTNERLDGIVFRDKEYRSINAKLSESYKELYKLEFTKQQKKCINDVLSLENALSARFAEIAYMRGLQDRRSLLRFLVR